MLKIILSQPSKIGWMEDDTVNSFTNLELRKTDVESYLFGQEGNLWNNIIFKVVVVVVELLLWNNIVSKVDEIYMNSCNGDSSAEMQKFCNFTNLIVAKQTDIESKSWFPEWQSINTIEEIVEIR